MLGVCEPGDGLIHGAVPTDLMGRLEDVEHRTEMVVVRSLHMGWLFAHPPSLLPHLVQN